MYGWLSRDHCTTPQRSSGHQNILLQAFFGKRNRKLKILERHLVFEPSRSLHPQDRIIPNSLFSLSLPPGFRQQVPGEIKYCGVLLRLQPLDKWQERHLQLRLFNESPGP